MYNEHGVFISQEPTWNPIGTHLEPTFKPTQNPLGTYLDSNIQLGTHLKQHLDFLDIDHLGEENCSSTLYYYLVYGPKLRQYRTAVHSRTGDPLNITVIRY